MFFRHETPTRLRKLEGDTHRYRVIIERSLYAHFHMGRDLERKVGAYEGRIKDLEKNICILLVNLTGFKLLCGIWRIKTASMKIVSRRLQKLP
jgi:hypothetical protein